MSHPTTHQDSATPTPPECVGPVAIPPALTHALRRLAEAAAVDDLVPLSVCATEVVRRLSPPGLPVRARVICGPLESVTPLPTRYPDAAASFRDALERSPARCVSTAPAEVVFLVSQDGDRLYVESAGTPAGAPTAEGWARAFLGLLSRAGTEPDQPLAGHALGGRERR